MAQKYNKVLKRLRSAILIRVWSIHVSAHLPIFKVKISCLQNEGCVTIMLTILFLKYCMLGASSSDCNQGMRSSSQRGPNGTGLRLSSSPPALLLKYASIRVMVLWALDGCNQSKTCAFKSNTLVTLPQQFHSYCPAAELTWLNAVQVIVWWFLSQEL